MSGRDLTDKEKKAWAAAARHVRPLHGRKATPQRLPRPEDGPSLMALALPQAQGPASSAPPQNRQGEKKIRRGKQVISASFDLHGHTQESAWTALPQWLANEQAKGSRCVIVITGKGKEGLGVLRRNFLHWLERPEARQLVSGYSQAHARHGGSGAWYVFLRRR